ncbi:tellurite resistance TerB family protein [Pasteurellaceae bacterium LIM206]|nr:tellurite resistance TerB family protein [Pasteurellaceae bacterium LIM206]
MDFNSILNQVLGSVQQSVKNTMAGGNSTTDKVTKYGATAAGIGILSMIFGRNGGSGLAKIGSLAALGSLAYQAYQDFQKSRTESPTAEIDQTHFEPTEAQAEDTSKLILQVMIAAAASDGAISDEERRAIQAQAGEDSEARQWIDLQMQQPVSPEMIAKQVNGNPALAAQVYLAARLVCADLDRKEIIFLSRLAAALGLDDALVEELEKKAGLSA